MNIPTILAHLNLPQYDVVRDLFRASFAAQVDGSAAAWYQQVLAFDVTDPRAEHRFPRMGLCGGFLSVPKRVADARYGERNAATKAAVTAGEYRINAKKVQAVADGQWESTKAFYAARVGEKIDALLEGAARIECSLSLNCFLVGTVKATLGEKVLVLETSLKTNYRYGEFAANRDMTVYRQVPTIVRSHSGFDLPAREAQIERETLPAKDARRAEIGKWQKEILGLEKQKRLWDDVYFSLNWDKNRAKDGHPDGTTVSKNDLRLLNESLGKINPSLVLAAYPTWEEAKTKVKELRAALKTAKLALREVRQPNSTEAVS